MNTIKTEVLDKIDFEQLSIKTFKEEQKSIVLHKGKRFEICLPSENICHGNCTEYKNKIGLTEILCEHLHIIEIIYCDSDASSQRLRRPISNLFKKESGFA